MAGPTATGGKPQPVTGSKTIQVKAHSRTVPLQRQLTNRGLTRGQANYQIAHHPGMNAGQILRARAKQIQRHNPNFYGQGANLSPLQANLQSKQAAQVKYGPTLRVDRQQLQNIPGWYQGYRNQLAQLQAQQVQAVQGLVGGINTAQAGLSQQQQTMQNQALSAMGQDAASRGASVDPSLAATSSQFQAGLNALSASDAARAQALGQSEQNYLTNLGQIQTAAGQRAQTAAQNKLSQDTQLSGDYQNQIRQQLIGQAQKVGIENATLGLNNQKANHAFQLGLQKLNLAKQVAGTKNALAQAKFNWQKQVKADANSMSTAKFEAQYGISPQQARNGVKPIRGIGKAGGGAGGAANFTPTQIRKNNTTYRSALQWAQGHHPTPGEEHDLEQALMAPKKGSEGQVVHDPSTGKIIYNPDGTPKRTGGSGGGLGITDPLLARVIAMMAIYNGVDAKTQRSFLRNYGIHLPVQRAPSTGPFQGTGRPKSQRPT